MPRWHKTVWCHPSTLTDAELRGTVPDGAGEGEPLEEYILPIGGGFFFALPGVQASDGWLGERLLS